MYINYNTNFILHNKYFFTRLSHLHRSAVVYNKPSFASAKEKNEFKSVFSQVIESLITSPKIAAVPEVANYVKKIFEYTVSEGKHCKGLYVPVAYQLLENPKQITKENLHSARVLGWCLEMLEGWLLACDDVVDGSTTRRGKPCWYLLPDVKSYPIVDSLLILQCIMQTLEVHFGNKPFYHDATRLFNETILYIAMGEYLNSCATHSKEKDATNFYTIEYYCARAKYTNSYYAFRLPICLAQLLMKNSNKSIPNQWMDLFFDLGILLQMKNDFLDVYGDISITGKIGSDIKEGKCSWLAVTALDRCNDTQLSIFKEYYGSKDPGHTEHIKKLYDDLQLPSVFKIQEKQRYSDITRRINDLPRQVKAKEISLTSS